jgi:hypothetical protein
LKKRLEIAKNMKNGVLKILRPRKLKYEKEGVRKIAVLGT